MRKIAPFENYSVSLCSVVVFGLLLALSSSASAQLPNTRLFAVFPPGGQAGTAVDLTITSGLELEEVNRLLFNHPGIVAAQKMQDVGGKPTPVVNQFAITVAGDVPPGNYEVRAVGFFGISNPRTFVIGAKKELNETEPNNTRETAPVIELNQTVNGRVNGATDIDWFKFAGKAGQRVLGDCAARRLDSKLDANLELYDATGKRLAAARNTLVSKDALLDVTLPADGDYFVKLHDFVYSGGEDYVYRLTMTTGPHIDFIMPPAGTPGSSAQYTVYGRNLPGGQPSDIVSRGRPLQKLVVNIPLPAQADTLDPKAVLDPFSAGMDAVPFSIPSPVGPSNAVMVYLSGAAPVVEVEPNNIAAQSQKIAVPGEIAGQFQSRGDVDAYTFEAKAKDAYWIEVIAHRAGRGAGPSESERQG